MCIRLICQECRREFRPEEERIYYGKKIICKTCLHQLARLGNICPVCGCPITEPEEGGVTLTLGPKSQTRRNLKDQNRVEPEVQFIVSLPHPVIASTPPPFSDFLHKLVKRKRTDRWVAPGRLRDGDDQQYKRMSAFTH